MGWYCFRVQCAFPYMEGVAMLNEKKSHKIWKKSEKNRGMVGDDVQGGALFRVQCAFPNMEERAFLNEK